LGVLRPIPGERGGAINARLSATLGTVSWPKTPFSG